MSSNTPSPERKEAPVAAAFLTTESYRTERAPESLGGQTLKEQLRIVRRHAKGMNVTIRHELVLVSSGEYDTPDARLSRLLKVLSTRSVQYLLTPASLYQHYTDDDLMKHTTLLMMCGTKLILVND